MLGFSGTSGVDFVRGVPAGGMDGKWGVGGAACVRSLSIVQIRRVFEVGSIGTSKLTAGTTADGSTTTRL